MTDQERSYEQRDPHLPLEGEEQRLLYAHQHHLAERAGADRTTSKLPRDGRTPPPGMLASLVYHATDRAEGYLRLPVDPARYHPEHLRWRIELYGPQGSKTIGLDVLGDVVLGRGTEPGCLPDLDLSPYGALELGVSRRHAVLKPTSQSLYLLDLQSRNGTQYNGMPMANGLARSLQTNDVITLGTLRLLIKIIDSPPMQRRTR